MVHEISPIPSSPIKSFEDKFPKRGKFLPAPALSAVEGTKGGWSLPSNGFIGGGIFDSNSPHPPSEG